METLKLEVDRLQKQLEFIFEEDQMRNDEDSQSEGVFYTSMSRKHILDLDILGPSVNGDVDQYNEMYPVSFLPGIPTLKGTTHTRCDAGDFVKGKCCGRWIGQGGS